MTPIEVSVAAIIVLALLAAAAVIVGTLILGLTGIALFLASLFAGWLAAP